MALLLFNKPKKRRRVDELMTLSVLADICFDNSSQSLAVLMGPSYFSMIFWDRRWCIRVWGCVKIKNILLPHTQARPSNGLTGLTHHTLSFLKYHCLRIVIEINPFIYETNNSRQITTEETHSPTNQTTNNECHANPIACRR
jgi:hypothetical protein